jgi:hypothetical protein
MPPGRHDVIQSSEAADSRTFSRLLETFQFLLDVTGCVAVTPSASSCEKTQNESPDAYLLPGGEGWKACIRVRMLHGIARRRIRQKLAREGLDYDESTDGVPISQEDMAATSVSSHQLPQIASHMSLDLPHFQQSRYGL